MIKIKVFRLGFEVEGCILGIDQNDLSSMIAFLKKEKMVENGSTIRIIRNGFSHYLICRFEQPPIAVSIDLCETCCGRYYHYQSVGNGDLDIAIMGCSTVGECGALSPDSEFKNVYTNSNAILGVVRRAA